MTITDIPQSGVYLQKAAVIELIVQFLDVSTGLPIQLQTASGLFIDILYPDQSGWRTFSASLYTDGSDGKIVYTTTASGIYADLNQSGLYLFQGRATVNGIALPPTYPLDFYVQGNILDNAVTPAFYPVLRANDGTLWTLFILETGAIDIQSADLNSSNILDTLWMLDATNQLWALTAIRTAPADAHLNTAKALGPAPAGSQVFLVDVTKRQWVMTVLNAGNVETR